MSVTSVTRSGHEQLTSAVMAPVSTTAVRRRLRRRGGLVISSVAASGPRGAAPILLTDPDLCIINYTAEQYAMRTDHLQVLMGCSLRGVQRTIARLLAAGLIGRHQPLAGRPWITPTIAGLRACGSPYATWRPRVGLLAHVAAVNEARLHIEARAPQAQWICERALAAERGTGEHLPDAVLLLDGRRVAVEVELTVKSAQRIESILDYLGASHDDVIYFCSAPARGRLERLTDSGRWPTLQIRDLPASGRRP